MGKYRDPRLAKKPFTEMEMFKLYEACGTWTDAKDKDYVARDRALIGILRVWGKRRIEILQLKRSDIEILTVIDQKYLSITFRLVKTFILDNERIHRKLIHLNYISDIWEYAQTIKDPQAYIFPGRDPRSHLHKNYINRLLNKLSDITGIPQVNPHRFRHTVGTLTARITKDPFAVKKTLDHIRISTSMGYVEREWGSSAKTEDMDV